MEWSKKDENSKCVCMCVCVHRFEQQRMKSPTRPFCSRQRLAHTNSGCRRGSPGWARWTRNAKPNFRHTNYYDNKSRVAIDYVLSPRLKSAWMHVNQNEHILGTSRIDARAVQPLPLVPCYGTQTNLNHLNKIIQHKLLADIETNALWLLERVCT